MPINEKDVADDAQNYVSNIIFDKKYSSFNVHFDSILQWKQNLKSRGKEIITRTFGCEFKNQGSLTVSDKAIIPTEVSIATHMKMNAVNLILHFVITSNLESGITESGFGQRY